MGHVTRRDELYFALCDASPFRDLYFLVVFDDEPVHDCWEGRQRMARMHSGIESITITSAAWMLSAVTDTVCVSPLWSIYVTMYSVWWGIIVLLRY